MGKLGEISLTDAVSSSSFHKATMPEDISHGHENNEAAKPPKTTTIGIRTDRTTIKTCKNLQGGLVNQHLRGRNGIGKKKKSCMITIRDHLNVW